MTKNVLRTVQTIWVPLVALGLTLCYGQRTLPEVRGCDCTCAIESTCVFDDSCTTITDTGVDINLGMLGVTCVIIETDVNDVFGSGGNDCILVRGGATVATISARDGDDFVSVQGSTVLGRINGANGFDCFKVTDSTIGSVSGDNHDDDIIISGSRTDAASMGVFQNIGGAAGVDCIQVLDSSIVNRVTGADGADCIEIKNSETGLILGDGGDDTIDISCSTVDTVAGGSDDDVIYTSFIAIQQTTTNPNFLNGDAGNDFIIATGGIMPTTNIPTPRIDGGVEDGFTDVCCNQIDDTIITRFCEDDTACPAMQRRKKQISPCIRRISIDTCSLFTTST